MEKNIIVVTDFDLDKVYPKYTILIKEDRFAISNGVNKVSEYNFVPIFDVIENILKKIDLFIKKMIGKIKFDRKNKEIKQDF